MSQDKVLMIVESPNKVKTLRQFLPSNYTIMASVGHITKIADTGLYNMGIDPNDNFKASYVVSPDKKEIVEQLKKQITGADKVILATDPDREGEAISYFLKKFLKIPDNKYERVTYHEITKRAVTEALAHPRKIDMDEATSAMTRARLDKIVGYRLSSIARKNVDAISVGRCQSAALKVVVEREEEITNFNSKKFYELYLPFIVDSDEYMAKFMGTDKKEQSQLESLDEVNKIISDCKDNKYILRGVSSKERHVVPKPPFTTSTFQQDVSSKLGIGVKQAMSCAQRLFEGIDINGKHVALITYIRTDSTEFAPEFVDSLYDFVKDKYGEKNFHKLREYKKSDTEQDGHEAIRPVDLSMTPEKLSSFISDAQLIKVYSIIYNRTVACAMNDQLIVDTTYNIYNEDYKFVFVNHAIKDKGFKTVYSYDKDEDDEFLPYINLNKGDVVKHSALEYKEKQTTPPSRFTEATLIKQLDKLGIGRPSTYATIVGILFDDKRGYCTVEGKTLQPTEKGITLSHFLDKHFGDIINIAYTAEMEKDLDLIAAGKLNDVDFLKTFYSQLEGEIKAVEPIKSSVEKTNKVCPECGSPLVIRTGKYSRFIGCSNYPKCHYTESIKK